MGMARVQTDNRFLDDLAKLAAGAMGTVHGVKTEMEAMVRQKFAAWLSDLDLVKREEFEAVKEMAEKARLENERLAQKLGALEDMIGASKTKAAPAAKARKATPETLGKVKISGNE